MAAAWQQLPCNLSKNLYKKMLVLITFYALNKVAKQEKFLNKPFVLCTIYYIKVISLLCSHITRWQLTELECLKLKDFDSHWWFDVPSQSHLLFIHINDIDINSLFQIADPSMARLRGCLRGTLNQNSTSSLNHMWQQHEHNIFTWHDSSAFKWVYATERLQSNGPLPQQCQIGIVCWQPDQTKMEPNPVHNASSMTESSIHINEFIELPEVIVVTKVIMMTADLTTNIASNLPIQWI